MNKYIYIESKWDRILPNIHFPAFSFYLYENSMTGLVSFSRWKWVQTRYKSDYFYFRILSGGRVYIPIQLSIFLKIVRFMSCSDSFSSGEPYESVRAVFTQVGWKLWKVKFWGIFSLSLSICYNSLSSRWERMRVQTVAQKLVVGMVRSNLTEQISFKCNRAHSFFISKILQVRKNFAI